MSFAKGTALGRLLTPLLGLLAATLITAAWYGVSRESAEPPPAAPVVDETLTATIENVATESDAPVAASVETEAATPAEAGMILYRDPETGEIGGMPPAGDPLLGASATTADPQLDPVETIHPDGSVSVLLNGHLEMYSVMTVGPDGKPVMTCTHDPSIVHVDCALPARVEDR